MKITGVKTRVVDLPFDKPITTAIHDMRSVGCVLLFIETDEGLVGESYAFTLNCVRIKAFNEMINGFNHLLIGKDPTSVTAITEAIWREINPTGYQGVTISALSAINTALWDLVGKIADLPLHRVFGACRDSVKTYASGGLWLSQSIDELVAEAQAFIAQGFRSMKIRVGSESNLQDVERVRAVREAVGDDIELLADANQAFTAKDAIRLGRLLEEFKLGWLEEPVNVNDIQGHADVRRALDMPIATGETVYTRYGMRPLIEQRCADVLMPDLQRIGGLTEMQRVCALASTFDIPISTHIFTEQSLSIAGSASNCISVEHMPWFSPLFNEQISIVNGSIAIPERPGTGFTFSQETISRYRVD
jgi:L-alanine-DL-glutamate epimerase-like enolase superfamily enzyme